LKVLALYSNLVAKIVSVDPAPGKKAGSYIIHLYTLTASSIALSISSK